MIKLNRDTGVNSHSSPSSETMKQEIKQLVSDEMTRKLVLRRLNIIMNIILIQARSYIFPFKNRYYTSSLFGQNPSFIVLVNPLKIEF